MAEIKPFKAVRPARDKVSLVAARSYDSYTTEQREARLRDNTFSFLHVVNPGYKYSQVIEGEKRYNLVRNRYQEFKEDGVFMQEQTPCYYIYKIVNHEGIAFTGIIAAASTQDYEKDIIKKHEDTLEYKEEPYSIKEAALLFESDAYLNLHKVIVVNSPIETRIERIMKRDHVKREDILKRIENQTTDRERMSRADWVIYNDGVNSLISQAMDVHHNILKMRESGVIQFKG